MIEKRLAREFKKGVRADIRIEVRRLREKGGPGAEALGSPFRG